MLYSWFTGCSGSRYIHSNILTSWVNGSREKFGVLFSFFLLCFAYVLLYILFKLWKTSEGTGQMCPSSFHHTIGVNRHSKTSNHASQPVQLFLRAWFITISRLVGHSISFWWRNEVYPLQDTDHALVCLKLGRLCVQAHINDYKISIWFFLVAKYAALRIKSKDSLARNHDNVSWEEQYVYLLTLSKLAL
jgi:hypothetical protein